MKFAAILSFALATQIAVAQAQQDLQKKVIRLEARVQALEKRLNSIEGQAKRGGLNVRDHNNSPMGARVPANRPTMTPEQQKEMMDTLKMYKKNREEQQKYLQELMNE